MGNFMKKADEEKMSLKEMIAVIAVAFVIMVTSALVFKHFTEARDKETKALGEHHG